MFDSALIPFEGLDSGEVRHDNEGSRYVLFVVMQDSG
jgi:hypothetical protein